MSFRTLLIGLLAAFCLLCGVLVVQSGYFQATQPDSSAGEPASNHRGLMLLQQTADVESAPAEQASIEPAAQPLPAEGGTFGATGGADVDITLGSVEPDSGFKFQLELDSKGAAIRSATFSEFKDRTPEKAPLQFLSPLQTAQGSEILSMATRSLALIDQGRRIRLGQLAWNAPDNDKVEATDGSQLASFEATITGPDNEPLLKLTKTYRVSPETYMLDSTLTIENLSEAQQRISYDLQGPVDPEREGFRQDMRKAIAGFANAQGQVDTVRFNIKKLRKADAGQGKALDPKKGGERFVWVAAVNKYFAAILVPMPEDDQQYVDWVARRTARVYDRSGDESADGSKETIGVSLETTIAQLQPAGQTGSSKTYNFQVYIGPKDKSLFDKNELYRSLGFVQTIDFMSCCCPAAIINPLAFGVLGIMKAMHFVIPNYGVVIIILVFLMRLILHPITKKSQISMSKMSKLAPRAEEIKKKYANNKQELNKRLMELYREQGASPITGMLPMLVQMPIWIALWSAVYSSIDLRGAAFLPFWITDLSVPDALIKWPTVIIPLLGWRLSSLNLLPIMMGVAFYFQQKLMPTQASAATNPQMAQQQKMMQIMMPLLFPLMLYNGPSGVNLYIMASTSAGVIEQKVIRKHIKEQEEMEAQGLVPATSKTGGKVKKKKPKPFFKNM